MRTFTSQPVAGNSFLNFFEFIKFSNSIESLSVIVKGANPEHMTVSFDLFLSGEPTTSCLEFGE